MPALPNGTLVPDPPDPPEKKSQAKRLTQARQKAKAPRHARVDERRAEIIQCLLGAAVRIIEDVGWHELSTNRVAKVAGLSIGTLYRYYPNRDALGRALVHKVWDDEVAAILRASVDGGLTPRALVSAYVRHVASAPRLYSEWATHLVHLVVAEDAPSWDEVAVELTCQAFDKVYEDHPRKRVACEILYVSLIHVVRRAARTSPELLLDGTIEKEAIALMEGYLSTFQKR